MSIESIKLALQPGGPLAAMAEFKHFCVYELIPSQTRQGKTDKIPCIPRSWKDPAGHLSAEQAFEAAASWNGPHPIGVGYLIWEDDPFFFLDLDQAREGKAWKPHVDELRKMIPKSAFEISSSNTGCHMFGSFEGEIKHAKKYAPLGLELYTSARLAALTGESMIGRASEMLTEGLKKLVEKYFEPGEDADHVEVDWEDLAHPEWDGIADDDELIQRFINSRATFAQILGSKATNRELWTQDEQAMIEAFPTTSESPWDRSSADMSMASRMAYWTGNNPVRMLRIMERSALVREKWELRPSYVVRTIEKAIRGCHRFYGGPREVEELSEEAIEAGWTSAHPEYRGETGAQAIAARMMSEDAESGRLSKAVKDVDLYAVANSALWNAGGDCDIALGICQSLVTADEPSMKSAIVAARAGMTEFRGVVAPTEEQAAIDATIPVDPGCIAFAEQQTLELLPRIPGLYQRGSALVTVLRNGRIRTLNPDGLSSTLERYLKFVKGKDNAKAAECPEVLARRLIGRLEWDGVREIKASISAPVARPDGSVVEAQGLDDSTGLYALSGLSREIRVLCDDEMRETLKRLWAPFRFFPFEDAVARGTFMAALLTTAARSALPTAPGIAINAQSPGTGKTLMLSSLALLAGASSEDALVALSDDRSEQAKQLSAYLSLGPAALAFDNKDGKFKASEEFCIACTSPSYRARILGRTETITLPNRALWIVSGNNMELQSDVIRRFLMVNLDSPEDPETRRFPFNPVELVETGFMGFREDLLDIFATFKARGRKPDGMSGYASFEAWNDLVRGCLLWALPLMPVEMEDPLEGMKRAKAEDPDRILLSRMLSIWQRRFPEGVAVRDIDSIPCEGALMREWRELYDECCTFKGRIDPQRLNYRMRHWRGRKVGGVKFGGGKDRSGATVWQVVPAE